ncbi:hypothetical protein BXZ70DRAFT_1010370 [Cristinia sonorae]|uniref:Uncharacterized protein n=1 Tax=Cristinia sonorae TaxID=1940300 RepID=A0A8K0UJC6_9AGAR|nr:hypothetical protein BXZ70DRAFT_1010370 [Cristinia sonorae]
MDDLYNNAWGESVQLDDPRPPKTTSDDAFKALKSSWTRTNVSPIGPSHAVEDNEADLAAPSWSTGAGIRWDEPSEDVHGFGWSHAEPDMAWGTDTYADIPIGKLSQVSLSLGTAQVDKQEERDDVETVTLSPPSTLASTLTASEPDIEGEEQVEETECTSTYQTIEEAEPDAPISPVERTLSSPIPDSPLRTPVPATLPSRSPSPDGFGGFSSGFEEPDSDGFKSVTAAEGLEDDAWGAAWSSAPVETTTDAEEVEVEDEWTAARKRQENIERRIPPGALEDIKNRCEELCKEITPPVDPKVLDVDPESYRNNLRLTLEDMDELSFVKQEYLPELTLQPPLNFQTTAIFKGTTHSLRLTRNLPMVKNSPMSHYLASKGSTAWEKAVRGRKEVVEEDVVPVGWRILEKDAPKPTAAPQKQTGGLFSFWGRKESRTNTPLAALSGPTLEASSSKPVLTTHTPKPSIEKRDSMESVRSTSSSSRNVETSSITSPAPSTLTQPAPTSHTAVPSAPSSSAPGPSTYADAPMLDLDGSEAPPTAAPSAVSRFLNRFSRRKSSVPSSSPRQSLALSSDDMDFLSDIVPSMSDDAEDNSISLQATLASEPLPPLLAPPPASSPASIKSLSMPPLLGPVVSGSKTLPPQPQATLNGFDSFFDTLDSVSTTTASMPVSTATAPILPPGPGSGTTRSISVLSRSQSPESKPASPSILPANSTHQPFGLPPPPAPLPRTQTPVLAPPPKPSFALPPPSSRTQTPTISPPPSRPLSGLSQPERSSTLPSRPKIPLMQIGIPPPPSTLSPTSAGSSPSPLSGAPLRATTPTSGVPLALLYPNAANATPGSSFGLPPPPGSRGHTPIPSRSGSASQTAHTSFPPLSTQNKPPSLTVLTAFDDDDDFADFQSSTPATHTANATPLASAASYQSHTTFQSPSSATHAPMLGGPPTSSSSGSLAAQKASAAAFFKSAVAAASKPAPLSFDSFDDEFSALGNTTTAVDSAQNASFNTSGSSLMSGSRSGFDGFDSFSSDSPGLGSPTPPIPPAKNPPPVTVAAPSPRKAPVRSNTLNKNKLTISSPPPVTYDTATRHQHTMSLMEMANARKGKQWPAPPSPLPQILNPPPQAPSKSNAGGFDLLGEDDSFGSFNTTSDGLFASTSSPAAFGQPLMPSGSTMSSIGVGALPQSQSVSSAGSGQWLMGAGSGLSSGSGSVQSLGVPPPAPAKGKMGGALTAQDLSFFEGL